MTGDLQELLGSKDVLRRLYFDPWGDCAFGVFVLTAAASAPQDRCLYRLGALGPELLRRGFLDVVHLPGMLIALPISNDQGMHPGRYHTTLSLRDEVPMRWWGRGPVIHQAFHTRGFVGVLDKKGYLWRIRVDKQLLHAYLVTCVPSPVIQPPILFRPGDGPGFLVLPLKTGFFVLDETHLEPVEPFHLNFDNALLLEWAPLGLDTALAVHTHGCVLLRLNASGWMPPFQHHFPNQSWGFSRPVLMDRKLWYVDGRGALYAIDPAKNATLYAGFFNGLKPCLPRALSSPDRTTLIAVDRRGRYFCWKGTEERAVEQPFFPSNTSAAGHVRIVDTRAQRRLLFLNWSSAGGNRSRDLQVDVFRWVGQGFLHESAWTITGRLERVFQESPEEHGAQNEADSLGLR